MPSVLMISYSGALGGAERILLDCAGALAGERNLACPEGELACAARAQGIRVLALPGRSIALRGSAIEPVRAFGRLAAHGREALRLIGDLDPDLVLAWGMRSALACLAGRSVPGADRLPAQRSAPGTADRPSHPPGRFPGRAGAGPLARDRGRS